jgi:glutathione synthase/RimK-type ligase-like ATP-grasp enzyme
LVSSIEPFLCHFIDKVEDIQSADPLRDILAHRSTVYKDNPPNRKVLMLTSSYDPEANLVGIGLRNRGIDYVRLNIDDVPCQARVSYSIGQDTDLAIEFTLRKYLYKPSGISVVWLRHFDIKEKDFGMREPGRTFSYQQWNHALEILQRNVAYKWINSPQATSQANDRAHQLSVAKATGFDIPDTLITNDPDAARDFYHSHNGEIVIKGLLDHSVIVQDKMYSMFTRRIREEDLSMLNDLIYAPCILQEQVFGRSELRITVVGDNIFAAELAPGPTVKRYGNVHLAVSRDLWIRTINLPDMIRIRCVELINSLGLRYGAIDFIRDDDEHLVFLEVNATGDWYWIESKTKLPITEAMVNLIEMLHKSELKASC